MENKTIKLTEEQENIVNAASDLNDILVEAFAGAAKTSTAALISEKLGSKGKSGLYLAFGKENQVDAERRMHSSMKARTFHSLAMSEVGHQFSSKLKAKLTGKSVAEALSIGNIFVSKGSISSSAIGYICIKGVENFCRTMDENVSLSHMPPYDMEGLTDGDQARIRSHALPYAKILWKKMSSLESDFPSSHSVYLKLWAMSNPVISGPDYAIFDEAQDADELMIHIMSNQDFPVIWIGDRWQQIYSWRGAVNAMEKVCVDKSLHLTQSFRFGNAIAAQANHVLSFMGEKKKIKGFDAVGSMVGKVKEPDAIVCRSNAQSIKEAILYKRLYNKPVVVPSLNDAKDLCEGMSALLSGERAMGKLGLFKTWAELVEYSENCGESDIRLMVNMVQEFGIKFLLEFMSEQERNNNEGIKIITAHRSKGLEWDNVILADDFRMPNPKKMPSLEEFRLLYVAMTRAKKMLDMSNIEMHKIINSFYKATESGIEKPKRTSTKDDFFMKQISKLRNK